MTVYVERVGTGPPLVLAHGFAGSARNFRPQVRALRDTHRVAVYDAPGHARSPAPEDPDAYRLASLVSSFGAVLEGTSDAPAVAGGLSMGAATALHYALAHPSRVRGLVLASIPAGRGATGGVSARASNFAEAIERDGLEAAGARFVWGPDSGLDTGAARLVRQGFLEHPPHALAATLRGAIRELPTVDELAPRLRECPLPTLVVAGADDPSSLAPSRRLVELLPRARLVVIPGAGHVVNLAQPAAFNQSLLDWLAELPDPAAADLDG